MNKLIEYIKAICSVALFFIALLVTYNAYAGAVMPDMNKLPPGNVNQTGVYNEAVSNATGIAPGGVTINNTTPASTAATGVIGGVGNDNSSGSSSQVRLNNVGATNFRNPVQPPPVFGYGSYSQASCMGSFGASGSGGAGGGGLLLPWESDDCNYRLNSAHMAALGKPKTACYIMTDNIDYVEDANKKAPDEACSNVGATNVAMPVPGAIVNQQTPTLDGVMPPHAHPDYDRKIDNAFRHSVAK